jgi:hypothetical protein
MMDVFKTYEELIDARLKIKQLENCIATIKHKLEGALWMINYIESNFSCENKEGG